MPFLDLASREKIDRIYDGKDQRRTKYQIAGVTDTIVVFFLWDKKRRENLNRLCY
jgi:hypothetical protein